MVVNDSSLASSYTLIKLSVHNSTQIASRTTAVISALLGDGTTPATTTDETNTKPSLVILTARSKAANKLISIVEIIKRDLAGKGVAVYQYNVLGSEMMEVPRGGEAKKGVESDADGVGEEAGFEMMGEKGDVKKRAVPIMTTYLSRGSVKELKVVYGYVSWFSHEA